MIEELKSLKAWTFEPSGDHAWHAYAWADFCGNDISIAFSLSQEDDHFVLSDHQAHILQAVRMGFAFDSDLFAHLKGFNPDSLAIFTANEGVLATCTAQDLPLVLNDALQCVLDFSFWCCEHGHTLADDIE